MKKLSLPFIVLGALLILLAGIVPFEDTGSERALLLGGGLAVAFGVLFDFVEGMWG